MYYRRRLGGAFGYALAAAVVALAGSGVALVAERTLWLGGDAEGMTERLETGAALRNLLLILAWALLLVAIARHRRTPGARAPRADQRPEPAVLARQLLGQAWRYYSGRTQRGRRG